MNPADCKYCANQDRCEPTQLVGHGSDVFGIHGGRGLADDFAEGAAGGSDYRATARHGLDRRQAKTFIERGVNEGCGGAVQIRQRLVGDESEGAHIRREGGVSNAWWIFSAPCQSLPPKTSCQSDPVWRLNSSKALTSRT